MAPRVPKKVDVPENLGTNGDGVGQIHLSPGLLQLRAMGCFYYYLILVTLSLNCLCTFFTHFLLTFYSLCSSLFTHFLLTSFLTFYSLFPLVPFRCNYFYSLRFTVAPCAARSFIPRDHALRAICR